MTDSPRVSVLMSVYNGARYLQEAVDSILGQTFDDFEFIIVDDGSTDATPAILDSYTDARIVRLRNEANIGLTRSLNKGLAVARGEYVARQDADDVSLPERLARQVAFLDAYPSIALVGTAYQEVFEDGRPDRQVSMPLKPGDVREQLLYHSCFCHGSVLARSVCLQAVDGYNEQFVVAQDWDLWLRLADRFDLANLEEILYQLRMSPRSITGRSRMSQRLAARRAVQAALERGLARPSRQALGRFYWQQALQELAVDNPETAKVFMDQAMAANPALDDDVDWLIQAAVSRGFDVAVSEGDCDYDAGFAFLKRLMAIVPGTPRHLRVRFRVARGEMNAAFAFSAFRQGDVRGVRRFCRQAWWSGGRQWQNLGLLSIYLRSWRMGLATLEP